MKPKKPKKQRPYVVTTFPLTEKQCYVLSDALTFLLELKDFSFEDHKISRDSANQASDKLFEGDTKLNRGEVRATAMAIDTVLLRLPGNSDKYPYMLKYDDEFLAALECDLPILQNLQPIFNTVVADLKKMK